jgi:hypothetical protein
MEQVRVGQVFAGVAVVAVGVALFVFSGDALAAPSHYFPKPHRGCRTGYVRRTVKMRERVHGQTLTVNRVECVVTPRPHVTFYWCSPDPTSTAANETSCSSPASPHEGDPPNPVHTTSGTPITLNAYAEGSLQRDVSPEGYLTYTISGPPGGSYAAQSWDESLVQWEPGCSQVSDSTGGASGMCQIVFNAPGTYTVALSFADTDRTYPNAKGPTETVSVS